MAEKTRLELILELNNRIGAGLTQAKTQIRSEIGGMQARLGEFAAKGKKDFKAIGDEIPVIGKGLGLMTNPIALAGSALTGLAAGFVKATNRAAEFNHEFRDLANLNLDKTQAELNGLRNMVLDSAWRKGFNAEKTVNAYNELQSTAGIYGAEARPIVEKQGEFALLMKTGMDEYVAGTAKAMANWRFGIDKLDAYNKSNYAAMQVGVVSFEELAKVQSTFAGSAASINQNFDTANKLFSLFTVKTKSVDEAATQTKSLFNDLTKASTIKAFQKVGISMFDANKQLKQADVIMLELNEKFMKMKDDKAIVSLKNQFVGSEGLIAMIQAATDKSGELRNMLDQFQNSKLNADMALSQAAQDIVARQEALANKIDNLVIRMGQILLPAKEWVVDKAEKVVDDVYWAQRSANERAGLINDEQTDAVARFDKTSDVRLMSDIEYKKYIAGLQINVDRYKKYFVDETTAALLEKRNTQFKDASSDAYLQAYDAMTDYGRQRNESRYAAYYKMLLNAQKERSKMQPFSTDPKATGSGASTSPSGGDLSGISDSLNKVVGSASAPRNITVNIDAFNKGGINTQNTSLQNMDASQIEDWFTDMCLRAINELELSYQ